MFVKGAIGDKVNVKSKRFAVNAIVILSLSNSDPLLLACVLISLYATYSPNNVICGTEHYKTDDKAMIKQELAITGWKGQNLIADN